jgi:hypothetical protein
VTKLMFDRLTLDSSNSSIPPSSDPNRKKDSKENDENESDSNKCYILQIPRSPG